MLEAATPTYAQLLRCLSQLAVMLVVAWGLGNVLNRKFGQPRVIGELLSGIVIGPSLLGVLFPGLYNGLFLPDNVDQEFMLKTFSWISIIFLVLVAGIETDLLAMRRHKRRVIPTALVSLSLPFLSGVSLAYFIADMPALNGNPEAPATFMLFLAIMLSISAVPVIAKILLDMRLLRTGVGVVIISAAVATDIVGWMLLSAGTALAEGGLGFGSLATSLVGTLLFLALAYLVGQQLVLFLASWARQLFGTYSVVTLMLLTTFSLAGITELMGVHAILGAFVAGLLIGNSRDLEAHVLRRMEKVVLAFFAPIYFAMAGIKVDLTQLFDPVLALLAFIVIALATLSKMLGGGFGAWLSGVPFWEAAAIGSGLNARGSMDIIAATIALSVGVFTQQMYSLIVVMALVTSMMAPPLLRRTLAKAKSYK